MYNNIYLFFREKYIFSLCNICTGYRFYSERFFIVYFMSFAGVNMSRITDLQVATEYEYERLFSKLCMSISFICIKN